MALHRRLVRVALMGLVVAGTFGCELMTAVDRDKIPEETPGAGGGSGGSAGSKDGGVGGQATGGSAGQAGSGGQAGTGGQAGKGGAGGSAGTGGSTPECTTASDCDAPTNECELATCNGGKCGTEAKAKGTAAGTQVAGDCKKIQCDGQGKTESVNDDADLPIDVNPCTKDVCTNGVASNPAEDNTKKCGTNDALTCDGNGKCTGCTTADQCPGGDNECESRACSAGGVCSLTLTPAGTPVANQTAGDCLENQCDGKGAIVSVNKDTDAVDDGNDCTQDICLNGSTTHPPKSASAVCSSDGGKVCDGAGKCVACTTASHCTGDPLPACKERVCTDTHTCDVGNVKADTALPKGSQVTGDCKEKQCDGSGNEVDVNLDTDVPNDSNDCTTDSCSAGVKVFTNKDLNTACGTNGSLKCDGNGKCVGCFTDADCSDGDACTTGEKCDNGSCVSGTGTLDCNDSNPCTDDSCVAATGCAHADNTAACDDGNACTTGDVCAAGSCTAGATPLNCDDTNPCTDDSCVAATGCAHANNTASCSDGNACTTGDTCADGTCHAGTVPLTCNDGNVCTTDTCNSGTGCVFTNNTDPCDDNDKCTTVDACSGGQCTGTVPPNCNDNNPCTNDSCVAATGCVNANNTATCDDGEVCTKDDVCAAGLCSGAPNPGAACGAAGVCNASGACVGCVNDSDCADSNPNDCLVPKCNGGTCGTQNAADNSNCSTGDPCKLSEKCSAGVCSISTPKCSGDICNDATCDIQGNCGLAPKQGTVPCDKDGSACTVNDVCVAGTCTAGAPKDCTGSVSDACHVATCNPADGVCGQATGNEGQACTFGSKCLMNKTCQAGLCTSTVQVTCDDQKACTDDTCNADTGCVFTPNLANTCTDSNACTVGDHCDNTGTCVAGTPVTCSALDQCHDVGTCDTTTGLCSNPNKTGSCNDGQFCTATDTCQGGTCTGTGAITCTTTNQCLDAATGVCNETTDKCDFTAKDNTTVCTDFTPTTDTCQNATTLRHYLTTGKCGTGTGACVQDFTDTACALGCSNGHCNTDLQITEYVEGTSTNKAIEITNLGAAGIDLATCVLRNYANANLTYSDIALSATPRILSPGESFVVCNNAGTTAQALKDRCQLLTGSLAFNGNDSMELVCNSVVKDSFGHVGETILDTVGWGTDPANSVNNTLRRKCTVTWGDTVSNDAFNPGTEWDGFAVDTFDGLGAHCSYTKTIAIDGTNDFSATLEKFAAGTGYSAYVTWDASYLYLAVEGAAVDSGSTAQWWLVYLSGTSGTNAGLTYNTQQPALPFNAGYHVRWKADNAYSNAQVWSGSAWADAAWDFNGDVFKGTGYVEMRIPLADIGSPSKVSIAMSMINETAMAEKTWAPFPSTSFTPDTYDPDYTKYYEFFLKGPLAPTAYTAK